MRPAVNSERSEFEASRQNRKNGFSPSRHLRSGVNVIKHFSVVIYATIGVTLVKISRKYIAGSINYAKKVFITLTPVANVVKTFYSRKLRHLKKASVFVPGKPFQPSLRVCG